MRGRKLDEGLSFLEGGELNFGVLVGKHLGLAHWRGELEGETVIVRKAR